MSKVTSSPRAVSNAVPRVVSPLNFEQTVARVEKALIRIRHLSEPARFPEEGAKLLAEALTSPLTFYRRYIRNAFDEQTLRPFKEFADLEKVVCGGDGKAISQDAAEQIIRSVLSKAWNAAEQDPRVTARTITEALAMGKAFELPDQAPASISAFEAQVPEAKAVAIQVPTDGGGALRISREPSGFVTVEMGPARQTWTPAEAEATLKRAEGVPAGDLPIFDGVRIKAESVANALKQAGVVSHAAIAPEVPAESPEAPSTPLPISPQSNLVAQMKDAQARGTAQNMGDALIARMKEAGMDKEGVLSDWLVRTSALSGEWTWTSVGVEKQGAEGKASIVCIGVPELFVVEYQPSRAPFGLSGVVDLRDF